MQEKHPIDERFRALLQDAEVAPPERVHLALAGRMGWRGNAAASTLPFLVVGFLGVALALVTWEKGDLRAQQPEATALVDMSTPSLEDGPPHTTGLTISGGTVSDEEEAITTIHDHATETEHTPSAHPVKAPPLGGKPPTSGLATHTAGTMTPAIASPPVATPRTQAPTREGTTYASTPDHPTSRSTVSANATAEASVAPISLPSDAPMKHLGVAGGMGQATSAADPSAPGVSTASNPASTTSSVARLETFMLDRLSPNNSWGALTPGVPQQVALPPPYVLPNGEWWWSIGLGISLASATWHGDGSDVLARAEQWRGGQQLGLGMGRSWRHGFGVGAGLNVERLRSDLQHESHTPGTTYTAVDTSWTTLSYPGWSDVVSVWSIDTATVVGPGSWERTTDRNSYTVLQLPFTAWWHTDVRRWSFGATAGVMGWLPVQRTGHTLARNTNDGAWTLTALDDRRTRDRFGPQLHGMAGLSVGYQASEHLRILAEPMYTTPLMMAPGNPSAALSRTSFQIRLQHALRCR